LSTIYCYDQFVSQDLPADPRITAMGLFVEAFHGLSAKFQPQLAEHGLATAEFEVLLRLSRSPRSELRMSDLAAQTQMSTSGITRVVDRLERHGLVERRACPADRRGAFAGLTPAGHAKVAAVLPDHLALIERHFTGLLGPGRLDAMLEDLRTIRDAVRPDATAGVA
jgi:MarR family transcriptional regulator, 2-MHQ and catechol-resistance regulon repressor